MNLERAAREHNCTSDDAPATIGIPVPAHDGQRIGCEAFDSILQGLFSVGLQLRTTMTLMDEPARTHLAGVIDALDGTIKELRSVIFSQHVTDAAR